MSADRDAPMTPQDRAELLDQARAITDRMKAVTDTATDEEFQALCASCEALVAQAWGDGPEERPS